MIPGVISGTCLKQLSVDLETQHPIIFENLRLARKGRQILIGGVNVVVNVVVNVNVADVADVSVPDFVDLKSIFLSFKDNFCSYKKF